MTVLGTVGIRDWHEGCMRTLGAQVVSYDVDGDTRQVYACEVPGLDSGHAALDGKVPCHFSNPEDVYQPYVLPCFEFRANDLTPAFDRHPWYQWVARMPAKGATEVILPDGTKGYTEYENQWRATQFDMTFDCMVLARRKQDSVLMLTYALRKFLPPWFIFQIVDSKGDVREYDAGEVSVSNTSELADIADRTTGWTISFTVRGEIDLHDEVILPAMLEPSISYTRFNPS